MFFLVERNSETPPVNLELEISLYTRVIKLTSVNKMAYRLLTWLSVNKLSGRVPVISASKIALGIQKYLLMLLFSKCHTKLPKEIETSLEAAFQ